MASAPPACSPILEVSADGELAVQRELRAHGLEWLLREYNLKARRHVQFPELVSLKYSQLKASFDQQVVRQCRGLVLNEKENWKVVCFAYTKFFNWMEKQADTIDWSTARVYEKMDGSLAALYHYADQWHVASSGTPDGASSVRGDLGFADLFWSVWKLCGYVLPENKERTYIFELMSARNRIVCVPREEVCLLHGVRELRTPYREVDPEEVGAQYGWRVVPSYPLSSLAEVRAACSRLDPLFHEGFVVRDACFRRVKIKSPAYVSLALLSANNVNNNNAEKMLEIVKLNEGSEFIGYYPHWKGLYTYLRSAYTRLLHEAQCHWDSHSTGSKVDAKLPAYHRLCVRALQAGTFTSPWEYFASLDSKELLRIMDVDPARVRTLSSLCVKQSEEAKEAGDTKKSKKNRARKRRKARAAKLEMQEAQRREQSQKQNDTADKGSAPSPDPSCAVDQQTPAKASPPIRTLDGDSIVCEDGLSIVASSSRSSRGVHPSADTAIAIATATATAVTPRVYSPPCVRKNAQRSNKAKKSKPPKEPQTVQKRAARRNNNADIDSILAEIELEEAQRESKQTKKKNKKGRRK